MNLDGKITYRPASTIKEQRAKVGGSFCTTEVLTVTVTDAGFQTQIAPIDRQIEKIFPDDATLDNDSAEKRFVAVDEELICGYLDVIYESWNQRLTIVDFQVDQEYRKQGIGRALIDLASGHAKTLGATHIWLEVTNINVPAIRAYKNMGFTFCGLDTMLYFGTSSASEIAMFMSRTLD